MVIAGVFFAAILYFESNGIININWDKLQSIAQSTVSSLTDLISTTASNGKNSSTLLPITSLDLPLTGSATAGFAIGFMKGWMRRTRNMPLSYLCIYLSHFDC